MTTIGDRIKARRLELDMSQDELARLVGYKSRSSINKIESDGRLLPQRKIMEIANALNTTPAYIMGWEESNETEAPSVPLTPRDERQIAADLEKMLADLDSKNAMAAMGGTVEDDEDRELLKASLQATMRLAKKIAKEKYTPKKYRHEEE
ncbi:helix-turn-helix domain-containing protein [Phascolarctobacterium succinatutens]|uniref:helix-turn-helix domain-containing protein n=1 Tax=Phascolarctobacterium succinatutens TaxID=626940 RepID=UPI0023F15FF5|nr:helix-turn-helix domain-containing protein [Phascolarctobacterium succinatutens]